MSFEQGLYPLYQGFYHHLYLACKANQYKSKKNFADAVEKIIYKKELEKKTQQQKQALKEKKTTKK